MQSNFCLNIGNSLPKKFRDGFGKTAVALFHILLALLATLTNQIVQKVVVKNAYMIPCKNKGIGDAGSTADIRMLWSAMVCLGLL